MKKEILVFIINGYADREPAYVCAELNSSDTDYVVRTIVLDKNPKVSMGGFHVLLDYAVDDYPTKFSLLILVGGRAWAEQKNNDVFPLVEYAVKHHIPVGVICNAVNFMAENGLNEIKHSGNTLEYIKSQAPLQG